MSDREKLLPCPFCGSEAEIAGKYAIRCKNSNCIIGSVAMMYRTKKLAIEEWNKRV